MSLIGWIASHGDQDLMEVGLQPSISTYTDDVVEEMPEIPIPNMENENINFDNSENIIVVRIYRIFLCVNLLQL